jgi:ferredoxin-NADP reductase
MNLRVSEVKQETPDTVTLNLVDADEGGRQFDYTPGQYLTFRFDHLGDKPVVRSYTMSSSPCEGNFSAFTVKEVQNGWVSKHLVRDVKAGEILRARGPIGKFCYDPSQDKEHLFMIAAGSGVTPFVSIMREYAENLGKPGSPKRMSLLVSFKSRQDLICWETLSRISPFGGIKIYVSLTRELATDQGFLTGRIDAKMLKTVLPANLSEATYMTCGPKDLMNLTQSFLIDNEVPKEQVKVEAFD